MQRKLFVAIDIDERAKNFIEKKNSKIKENLDIRWVDKENYHITLSFLGYVEDDDLAELGMKISEAVEEIETFDIHLNKIILAPNKENPKMIWLTGEKNQELIELRHKIEQVVSSIELEKKEFRPHINLGKIKGTKTKENALQQASEIEKDVNLLVPVTGIKIFESKIEKKRQHYFTIDSIDFN